jgi:hypothetical protein
MSSDNSSPLVEEIPASLCTSEQVVNWSEYGLRDPVDLDELLDYKHGLAICHENETITCISPRGYGEIPLLNGDRDSLLLEFGETNPSMEIVGETDEDIVKTAEGRR